MSVRTNLTKLSFIAEVQKFLGTTEPLDADPLGLDTWEIRDGTTYDIQIAKKVTLHCTEPDGRKFTVDVEGRKTLEDVCQSCHRQFGLKPWIRVSIKRKDDQPFFAEDGGEYFFMTQYDPALDPRPEVRLRIDLTDRTYYIPKFRIDDDPAKIMLALENYGFVKTGPSLVRFPTPTPWTTGQEVIIVFKAPTACSKVTLEPFTRRKFRLHIADVPVETNEVILQTALNKHKIWEHLQKIYSGMLPDVSQLRIFVGHLDITSNDKWPPGTIDAIPVKFPVQWRIERPQEESGFYETRQKDMTPMYTAIEAWQMLHNQEPRLFEEATLDYAVKLKPGCIIAASVRRADVPLHIRFEIYGKATITYELTIPNMATWQAIHSHFAGYDLRIPPYSCYIEEENRPYYPETLLIFRLKKGEEPPDTRNQPGGVSGGLSRDGHLLPPIVAPPPVIDTTGGSKVHGALTGTVGEDKMTSDSSSDSGEDDENEDDRKLHQLSQAAVKEVPLTIEIRAEYVWGLKLYEAIFSKTSKNTKKIIDLKAPLLTAYAELETVGRTFQGGGVPHSSSSSFS
jgi:hypothetical protein